MGGSQVAEQDVFRQPARVLAAVIVVLVFLTFAPNAVAAEFSDSSPQDQIVWLQAHTLSRDDATSFLQVPGLVMTSVATMRRCDPAPSVACYDAWGGGTWEDLQSGQKWPAIAIPWGVDVRWSRQSEIWQDQLAQKAISYGAVEKTPTQVTIFDDHGGVYQSATSYRASGQWFVSASCDTPLSDLSTQFKYAHQSVASSVLVDCAKRLVAAQYAKLGVTPVEVSVPGSPTGVLVSVKGGSATVTWLAPDKDGGAPITVYRATSSDGSLTCSGAPTPAVVQSCSVSGAKPGASYSFSVVATNGAGDSQPSAPSKSASGTVSPSAPVSAVARASGTTAVVAWKRPLSLGGLPLMRYVVTASPGSLTCTTTATSCAFSGLEQSRRYKFEVRAINARGAGTASTTKWVQTGIAAPDKPQAPVS